MSREAVTYLCILLNNDLQPLGFGDYPMPVALKVTVALNFYTSTSFQGSTGDLCGVSQSAVHRCIREVTDPLYRRAGDYVSFRTDPESHVERAVEFGAIAEFPQVQGVIDGTTSCIPQQKGLLLAQLQLLLLLLFTPPAQIQGWILGDKGYPLLTWLLTLVRNTSNDAEVCYIACHGSTPATIEQAIGMLRMRFHCLDTLGGALQYAPDKVGCIVVVYCILHNIAVQRREALQDDEVGEQETSSDDEDTEGIQEQPGMRAQRALMEGIHGKW
ncbi:putative nuclease HARBI1 [Heterodontus francisci]|uniref:putative nuclease HARBI1 n=1 Tax=Heterodontus francisci TaxID=7792 RepID=UPI00355BFE09